MDKSNIFNLKSQIHVIKKNKNKNLIINKKKFC